MMRIPWVGALVRRRAERARLEAEERDEEERARYREEVGAMIDRMQHLMGDIARQVDERFGVAPGQADRRGEGD